MRVLGNLRRRNPLHPPLGLRGTLGIWVRMRRSSYIHLRGTNWQILMFTWSLSNLQLMGLAMVQVSLQSQVT
jgi:hypothetical protein